MNFLSVFMKMMELFFILIIGYAAARLDVLNREGKAHLSKLILNITMPCTILSSVMMADSLPGTEKILRLLAVAFLTYVVLYVLAKATSFLLRLSGRQKAVAEFGIMFANVGFIGFPVTQAIFGSASAFYTSVFNMPFNLLCYSLGIYLIQKGNASVEKKNEPAVRPGKSVLQLFLNPGLLAAILGLVMALCKYQGPRVLGETFETLGGITTPGALLIIGAALAEMPVKEMFGSIRAYLVTVVSVLVTPVVMYLVFAPFVASDALLLGETVIIAGMPVATAGTMLCVEYGGDEKFMAQITFLSTLCSVFTIPVLAMLL